MNSPDISVPDDFHKLVPVCKSSGEVFKSRAFRYAFIQILKQINIPKVEIWDRVATLEALVYNQRVKSRKLLKLREVCKHPAVSKYAQELFGQLEFTWVNSAARKNLREVLAIEVWHGDKTSQKIISQILVMIYNILPQKVLKTISDAEIEKEASKSA